MDLLQSAPSLIDIRFTIFSNLGPKNTISVGGDVGGFIVGNIPWLAGTEVSFRALCVRV